MVSIAASYVYTFAAITAVGTLLMFSFAAYADTLQTIPETCKIRDLAEHVASKITEVVTLVGSTNSTLEIRLQMPVAIGNRRYWIRLRNDSSSSWVEAGFGELSDVSSDLQVYFPHTVCSGHYISGYGAAVIQCWVNGNLPYLVLNCSGGSGGI